MHQVVSDKFPGLTRGVAIVVKQDADGALRCHILTQRSAKDIALRTEK